MSEENEVKPEIVSVKHKSKGTVAKKVFSWISGTLLVLICGFALVYQIVTSISKSSNYGVANFFGYQTLVIATDSMSPTYTVDSAVIVKKVGLDEIKEGDNITFYYTNWSAIVTHRVLKIETATSNNETTYKFTCHGINTESEFCKEPDGTYGDCTGQTQVVEGQYVLGKVIYNSKAIGGFYTFLMKPYGLITLILIPASYVIIASVIDIIKAKKMPDDDELIVTTAGDGPDNTKKSKDKIDNLSAEDKERLKKDLLNQMMDEKNKKDKKDKDKKEDK